MSETFFNVADGRSRRGWSGCLSIRTTASAKCCRIAVAGAACAAAP